MKINAKKIRREIYEFMRKNIPTEFEITAPIVYDKQTPYITKYSIMYKDEKSEASCLELYTGICGLYLYDRHCDYIKLGFWFSIFYLYPILIKYEKDWLKRKKLNEEKYLERYLKEKLYFRL